MTLTLRQLIDVWGAPQGGTFDSDATLGRVCTDSRQLQTGDFFVPLVGERFDGHRFLDQLPERKVQAAVVNRSWTEPLPPELLHWRVDDTLLAYQQLALLHRRALGKPLVAVTGSAGKTTTRELIRAALKPLGSIVASEGNNNNDVGVPLTVLGATAADAALVIEMGMRGPGEIERLSRSTEPDLAVITNIGTAHIGRLGSREAIAAAKCEITAGLHPKGTVVIPSGDPLLESALAAVWSGRVLRVRLADDPEATSDLKSADLMSWCDRWRSVADRCGSSPASTRGTPQRPQSAFCGGGGRSIGCVSHGVARDAGDGAGWTQPPPAAGWPHASR